MHQVTIMSRQSNSSRADHPRLGKDFCLSFMGNCIGTSYFTLMYNLTKIIAWDYIGPNRTGLKARSYENTIDSAYFSGCVRVWECWWGLSLASVVFGTSKVRRLFNPNSSTQQIHLKTQLSNVTQLRPMWFAPSHIIDHCSAEYGLVRERPRLYVLTVQEDQQNWIREHGALATVLSSSESIEVLSEDEASQKKGANAVVNETTRVLLELSGVMLEKELKRLKSSQVRFEFSL